ncbi:CRAL TRIO domain protein (macronuclear) [Tetrahymena thermophila SB210]|uniref:CRAL TRIO domain protein n=1 Tax=Tetrahymena thermophila (strain SB210) TaxID=312017 RepID=Q22MA8_TETTS|nr:CRAL TRIO domain protein [Tetrahymena thermophila SB210]EAR86555.2 CRAL TRIO domain protein [Tetrahymena thermophila SB210]|eukprot:XP_977112.2 CRAL TRIO domain protein [Tetrahymena thermophila SB210]
MEEVKNIDPAVGFDPSYLRPPADYVNIKHEDKYILHGEGKKAGRKIYHNTQFSAFEQQGIAQFKQVLEKDQEIKLPSDWTDVDNLKMCYSARFDMQKCIKQTKEHIAWRNDVDMHTIDEESKKLLESGFVYLLGRDKQYRPVVVLDCTKINVKKQGEKNVMRALCVLQDMIKKYMFVNYHIENWVFIIDTGGMGLFDLPINALKMIIGAMSINYCACMDKVFILNPSFGLNASWSVVSAMMDHESAEKITMLKKDKYPKILEKIPAEMLEQKFGGKVPNVTQFWPPVDIYH